LRKDRRGIEGLPLRLMIVALLISLTLPFVLSTMGSVTSTMVQDKAAETVEGLAMTIERMARDGPGNVRLVEMPSDLPIGIFIIIGGGEGSGESMRITWSVDGEFRHRYLLDAVVLTRDGEPLRLVAGDSVRLICPPNDWGTVRAERA